MAFIKWFSKDKKDSVSHGESLTLSDVVRGLQFCVNSSTEIAERHYTTTLDKYLDEDNKPFVKRVCLDQKHAMDVPLLCLTDHSSLAIDEMKVKLNVNIRDMALKEADLPNHEGDESKISRSCLVVDLCNVVPQQDGTDLELQLTFKASQPPESFSRIVETLNNAIAVQLIEKE